MSLPFEFKAETIIKEGRTTPLLLQEMKKWLLTTSLPKLQDEFLVLFLLSCENNVAAAQNVIEAYFRIKTEAPYIFTNRNIDDKLVMKSMGVINISSIPRRMDNNAAIHFFHLKDSNYRNFDLITIVKLSLMLVEVSQRHDPPNKLIVIIDQKEASFMHLSCLKISVIKKYMDFIQEAMPLKICKIHILNANYIFHKILAVIGMFIKSDLLQAIETHPPTLTMEEFHKKHVPAACLPKEYGGECGSLEELNRRTIKQFRELKPFYEAEEMLLASYRNNKQDSSAN